MAGIATFYELLGVPSDASVVQVRDAYRHLALVFHPDTGGASSDDMALLNEAWHTLSDPGRRAAYDASLRPRAATFYRFDAPTPDDDVDPISISRRFAEPRRWPAATLMVLAAMGVIFVFTAYALGGGRSTVEVESLTPLAVGQCVSIRPGAAAVEVKCSRPHFGTVRAVVKRGAPCLPGTEGYFDRNSDAMVCVQVG
jgi:DnaJ domain